MKESDNVDSESDTSETSDVQSVDEKISGSDTERITVTDGESSSNGTITSDHIEAGGEQSEVTNMASSFKISAPVFGGDKKFEQYMMEVDAWCAVQHGVEKKDQAVVLALSLPDNDTTGVKDKLFHDIPLTELNCEGGVQKFKDFMNGLFKRDDLTMVYERYSQFENCRRESSETVEEYILNFDRLHNRAQKKGLVYPEVIKAFKLLDNSRSPGSDKLIVLTAVDFNKKRGTLHTNAASTEEISR